MNDYAVESHPPNCYGNAMGFPAFLAIVILLCLGGGPGRAAEFNPFFKTIPPPPPPILITIQQQIARGCVSNNQGKRPLADRYDLRHGLPQIADPGLVRAAAAISIADPEYTTARQWLRPLLADADPRTAYAAHTVLLSHGVRRMAAKDDTTGIGDDLRRAGGLADAIHANHSDLLFWQALITMQTVSGAQALHLVRKAIQADPWFYNARLLELELLLARSRRHILVSGARCREQTEAVLNATVALFGLDTCPRHAVLLLNWLRAGQSDISDDPFAQLVRAYVAILLNNRPAFHGALETISHASHAPCRRQVLARGRTLAKLLDGDGQTPSQRP
uniref:Uncharacterized protein n=1 Tax=Candidatus Kentrum sp. FM TaxID=2126340 RepID=A0A450SJ76_9GAMM|nr:MAG: hypothetical protein BECKFM1743C_GA0114222_100144 [Candidatus Kentron sp. FM]VFJ53486.1 MAG: hypothetical protein BECKFM1743A_GA0114220_101154 [Candidatus Kentron sp. FM]VFK06339.1 MAG: hypothetical protein BECKFM1743B_GA0114221_1001414 [Candidatus Kentron sp. FM]